jgi:hypothetical protein
MEIKQPITVLHIDDDEDNFKALRNKAREINIVLKYAKSLEEAKEVLKSNFDIQGVVLDGLGFINKTDVAGQETEAFVVKAIIEISKIEELQKRYIGKIVLTAFADKLKDVLSAFDLIDIFDKKLVALNEIDIFEKFLIKVENTEQTRIVSLHPALFAFIKENLNNEYLYFYKIFKDAETREKSLTFNELRTIFEAIFEQLIKNDRLPSYFLNKFNVPVLDNIIYYLQGHSYTYVNSKVQVEFLKPPDLTSKIDSQIIYCIQFIKNICSKFSHAHDDEQNLNKYQACLNCIIEVLEWSKEYNKKL